MRKGVSVEKEGVGSTQRGPTNHRALAQTVFDLLSRCVNHFSVYLVNLATKAVVSNLRGTRWSTEIKADFQ